MFASAKVPSFLVAAAFLGGCSQAGAVAPLPSDAGAETGIGTDAGAPGTDAAAPTLQSLSISSGALRPVFDPGVTDYDVTSLNSLYPVQVTAAASDTAATLTVHGAPAQSGVAASFTLKAGEDVPVVVSSGGASQTYTIHYVPKDLPAFTTTTTPAAGTENVLLSTLSLNPAVATYLMMIDRSGAPLYYRTFLQQDVEDFQQVKLPSGATVYTCTVGEFNPQGWTLGMDHVMDQQFNDVVDLQLLANAQHGVLPAEAHDFVLLDTDHYIAMSYVQRTVDLSALNPAWSSQAPVMNAIVQEVNAGAVVSEWDSGNVLSLYTDSVDGNAFTSSAVSDYLHLNSIDVDPADGNYILSFRHTNSIVKVDHQAHIVWTLGGKEDMFGLTEDQAFSHQHHARVHPDGSITLFDNGNNAHQSRVLSFVLDEVNHVVTSFQVLYTKPLDQPQTGFMGSAVPLGSSRYFFGWGGWFTTQLAPAATEIENGSIAWSLQFTTPELFSYRALPIASP